VVAPVLLRTGVREVTQRILCLVHRSVFPEKREISRVGDAGFEPATSAV
jgi:hypothetical protein